MFTHAIQKLKTALYWLPNKVSHPDFLFFLYVTTRQDQFSSPNYLFPGFSNPVLPFTLFLPPEISHAPSLLAKVFLIFQCPLKICILYDTSFPSLDILLLILHLNLHFSPLFLLYVIDYCSENILNSVGLIPYITHYTTQKLFH